MINYEDIRPLSDEEARNIIPKIFSSKIFQESFYHFFVKKIAPTIEKKEFKDIIEQFKSVKSVEDVQWAANRISEININDKTGGIIVEGFNKLDKSKKYNFISTHSNILGDPYYFGYSLMKEGFNSPMLGIGLNLTPIKIMKNLMKGQGCFIVKRHITKKDLTNKINGEEILITKNEAKKNNYVNLSHLIYNLYFEQNKSIWLPNRHGRSKDNNHATESSIFHMMNESFISNKMNFSDMINLYNITPVIVAYEYTPVAQDFAKEMLNGKISVSNKIKKNIDDIKTSYKGLARFNGEIKIVVGQPIKENCADKKQLSKRIDYFILKNFPVWNSNKICYTMKNEGIYNSKVENLINNSKDFEFVQYIRELENNIREKVINYYSKPIEKKIASRINPF